MTRVRVPGILVTLIMAACNTPGPESAAPATAAARARSPRQYTVEDFYKNSEFFGASWAPDNQKLLVSSNLSGIWNAYAVSAPAARRSR